MALETTIEQVEGRVPVTVVALDGELDASNFERPHRDGARPLRRGARQLLLDLTDLRSWRAPGSSRSTRSCGSCTASHRPTPRPAGRRCITADVDGTPRPRSSCARRSPAVERVLARTGLDRLFIVHPDRATAIAAF